MPDEPITEREAAQAAISELGSLKKIDGPSKDLSNPSSGGGQPGGGEGVVASAPAPEPAVKPIPASPDASTPAVQDPAKPDPAVQDPAKPDPAVQEPAKPDPEKGEPENPEAAAIAAAAEPPQKGEGAETIIPKEQQVIPEAGTFSTEEEPIAGALPNTPEAETERYESLSERTGFDISNDEDIVSLVENLKKTDPLEGVSPLLIQAIELEKKGGDVKQFLSILGVNVDGLSNKKALFEKYLTSDPSLVDDEGYAQEKFDRQYDAKYSILLDEKLDVDFDTTEKYEQYKKDREFAKKELEWEGKTAKRELTEKKESLLSNITPAAPEGPSEKTIKAHKQYETDAEAFLEDFETIQIPIDEEGKSFFNVPLNSESRPLLEEWSKSPDKFMDFIGIPSNGAVDAEKLNSHMAMTAMWAIGGKKGLGFIFANAMTERKNDKTLEHGLIHPAPENRASAGSHGSSQQEVLNESIVALRDLVAAKR